MCVHLGNGNFYMNFIVESAGVLVHMHKGYARNENKNAYAQACATTTLYLAKKVPSHL